MGDGIAALYDPLIAPLDLLGVRRWRQWAVGAARGRVLEIGVGTGLNLRYYRAAAEIFAIDPDGASLQRAAVRPRSGNGARLTLYRASAEALPFANAVFDTVLGTLVFCSIPDAALALAEARRVLKPDGNFRLIEHVRAGNRAIAAAQDAVTPVWKQMAGGCHLNRDTLAAVERAGFQVRSVQRHLGGLVIAIDCSK
jgi:ubiquinone/menaquinone biosynthesis C-methylase UbiE